MLGRRLGRDVAPLRLSDLCEPRAPDTPRSFRGPMVRIEPRVTVHGVPWGVLTFGWVADQELRCPLFPTLWAATAPLEVGCGYHVVGRVTFRDGAPAIGIVAIERSVMWRLR